MTFTFLHALTGEWGLVEGYSVSVDMTLCYLPLSEKLEGLSLCEDIAKLFPNSVSIRVHIDTRQCIVSTVAGVHAANTL